MRKPVSEKCDGSLFLLHREACLILGDNEHVAPGRLRGGRLLSGLSELQFSRSALKTMASDFGRLNSWTA